MNNGTTGRASVPGWWNDEQDVMAHIEDDLAIGVISVMTEYGLINHDAFGSWIVDIDQYRFDENGETNPIALIISEFSGTGPVDHVITESLAQALSWWSVGENSLTPVHEGVWKAEKDLYIRSLRNSRMRPANKKHNELEIFIEDGTPTALAQCCHCRAIYHQEYYPELEKDLYEFDEQYAVLSGKNAECTYCLEAKLLRK